MVTALSELGHRAIAIDLPSSGLNASYPVSYFANDFEALQTEISPQKELGLQITPTSSSPSLSGSPKPVPSHSSAIALAVAR